MYNDDDCDGDDITALSYSSSNTITLPDIFNLNKVSIYNKDEDDVEYL